MKPQVFITLTTGRSGTQKLQTVLSTVPGMIAEHEADPCYSSALKANVANPQTGLEFVRNKLERINSLDCKYYCDTTFVITQGFVEHFLSLGVVPNVIILSRDPRLVASSKYSIHAIPGDFDDDECYALLPSDPGVLQYPGWETAHRYQLCYWLCLEIARRTKLYSQMLRDRGALVWETTVADLNDVDRVNAMLTYFSLPNVSEVSTEVINFKADRKTRQLPCAEELDRLEREVLERVGSLSFIPT